MPSPLIAAAAAALLYAAGSGAIAPDVTMFERAEVASGIEVLPVGVIEDTRCADPILCFQDNTLVIAAIVYEGDNKKAYALQLGQPVRIDDGELTLVATSTPPSTQGAIAMKDYRLSFAFTPIGGD